MAVVIPWETIIAIHITTYLSVIIIVARVWIRLRFVNIYKRSQERASRVHGEAAQSRVVVGSSMSADDWVALASLVPLLMRLPIIHLSFVYGGTNVAHPEQLSEAELRGRQEGQKLLIGSRMLLVIYYWMMKICIAIFYKRLVSLRKPYERAADVLMVFVVLLFFPTPIAGLLECRPFHHNWQMIPRPPAACVTGLITVWTQGLTDVATNIALILFPIPIIVQTSLPRSKKLQLITLFSLGFLIVIITLIRLPIVVYKAANSQFIRTLWTSVEVLVSTIVANAPLTKGFISGTMVSRRDKSTSNSETGGSGSRSEGIGVTTSSPNGLVGGNKGEAICMSVYTPKRRKGSFSDSDEALNPVGNANNSVTTLESSQPAPPGYSRKITSHAL